MRFVGRRDGIWGERRSAVLFGLCVKSYLLPGMKSFVIEVICYLLSGSRGMRSMLWSAQHSDFCGWSDGEGDNSRCAFEDFIYNCCCPFIYWCGMEMSFIIDGLVVSSIRANHL